MKPSAWTSGPRHAMLALGLPLLLSVAATAHAQASRTWVSGVGDDANPCSRTAPCLSLAGALAKTAAGGEIDALDPGAFDYVNGTYTPLLIDKPITIDGGAGHVASLGPMSAGDALLQADSIIVQLAPGATGGVVLRNLSLNGFGGTGRNGIRLLSPTSLSLSNVHVAHYAQNCLLVDAGAAGALVDVSKSTFLNCGTGIANTASAGINLGDTLVALNSTAGISSATAQGPVWLFNSRPIDNPRNTQLGSFTGGSTSLSGGTDPSCAFASQQFVEPSTVAPTLPDAVPAAAAFQFTTTPCGALATITVSVSYAQALPAGTRLYKYGPATPGAPTSTWFPLAGAVLSPDRTTFTYTVTDNGVGDLDSTPGVINDPVLPVLPPNEAIPTLSGTALAALGLLLAGLGQVALRRPRRQPAAPRAREG